jgi:hypothetical protein
LVRMTYHCCDESVDYITADTRIMPPIL